MLRVNLGRLAFGLVLYWYLNEAEVGEAAVASPWT
jgi:hypothetical protein